VGNDHEAEERLGKDVKHSVGNGLSVGRQLVGALGKDPDDGVERPEDHGEVHGVLEARPHVEQEVVLDEFFLLHGRGVGAKIRLIASMILVVPSAELPKDGEEAKHGEAPEGPLRVVAQKGANETGDDHEHINEKKPHKVVEGRGNPLGILFLERNGHGGKLEKHDGSGDGPVDVTSVVEGAAVAAPDNVAVAGGHGEVGEGSAEADEARREEGEVATEGSSSGENSKITIANGLRFTNGVGALAHPPKGRDEEEGEASPEGPGLVTTRSLELTVWSGQPPLERRR